MFGFARTRRDDGPRGLRGHRAYAVGDVHGRADLLDRILGEIEADIAKRPAKKTLLVFLGDLIDRGPSSAEVVETLRTYRRPGVHPVFLLGNHEEVLLRILGGEASLIDKWRWVGGAECLRSYGLDPERLTNVDESVALALVREAIPKEHADFLRSFVDTCSFGDYLFVHAGIRPGVALDDQRQADLRWIRNAFLNDDTDHGVIVVHGHTISRAVDEQPNRIGIDTGAYVNGVLTALAIEDSKRWYLATTEVAEPTAVPEAH
jgi:serine/threonine protein phosphatase 1